MFRTSLDHIPDRIVCGFFYVQQLIDAAEQHGVSVRRLFARTVSRNAERAYRISPVRKNVIISPEPN